MYCVYILQSEKSGRYYIGSTGNMERRLVEHNSGKTKSLRCSRPLRIVFRKEFVEESDARQVERKLKKLKSRTIIEQIIVDQKLIMGP
ncbi:MAG: GIY-YIG nuclease family protein [bacterium]|nr:GIY-YIG nuclease family protein [bacterium]